MVRHFFHKFQCSLLYLIKMKTILLILYSPNSGIINQVNFMIMIEEEFSNYGISIFLIKKKVFMKI